MNIIKYLIQSILIAKNDVEPFLNAMTGTYTAPESSPQANTKNFGVADVYKMTKLLEDGRENW